MIRLGHVALAGMLVAGAGLAPADPGDGGTEIGPLVTLVGDAQRPLGLAVDGDGQVYLGEWGGGVRRASPGESLVTIAGFSSVGGVALDPSGLYVADPVGRRVWRVSGGQADQVVGTGDQGASGDGGPATDARLQRPLDVAVGPAGEVYIADSGANQVRMVRTSAPGEPLGTGGTISTVAGTGEEGAAGDGGPAAEAQLWSPYRVAAGPDGALYILESGRSGGAQIRRVGPEGTISTVVGGGTCGEEGEGGSPSLCAGASDIAVDAEGVLYISDRASDAVWTLPPDGQPVRLPIYLDGLLSMTIGQDGALYVGRRVSGQSHVVQRVSLAVPVPPVATASVESERDDRSSGMLAPVAGTGVGGFSGDGGPAVQAQLAEPGQLAVGPDGTVYVADRLNNRIRSIGADGIIETFAGNGELADLPPREITGPAPGDGELATQVPLRSPAGAGPNGGLATGLDGSLFICDERGSRVYRVSPLGVVTTFAGTGERAYAGDGGFAVDAALAGPVDVAVGPDGGVYIADRGNDRIRRVGPDGIITTVAELDRPAAIDVTAGGTVYAAAADRIWKVDPSGTVTRITPDPDGVTHPIGPGDIAVGPDGLVYMSSGAQVFAIRDDGTTRVVAGTGAESERAGGEEEPATEADLPVVNAIALDRAGNLYLSHTAANQVTVVVRVTEEPSEFPWHWVVLAVVAATALGTAVLSRWGIRQAERGPAGGHNAGG